MKTASANNRYIELIHSDPDYIFSSKGWILDESEQRRLASRLIGARNIICEIGSGSGGHLIEQALANPQILFVGLELRFKRAFRTAQKARDLNIQNLIVVRHDAKQISDLFLAQSLCGVYINFPDPWAKKRRWLKHKLLKPEYLQVIHSRLPSGGFLSYKTDHQQNFLETKKYVQDQGIFRLSRYSEDLQRSEFCDKNITTEFEKLFISKGYPIYYMYLEKN